MNSLTAVWISLLRLVTGRAELKLAPRFFPVVTPVPVEARSSWQWRREINFNKQRFRRTVRYQIPMTMLLGFLVLPLSVALADVLYVGQLELDGDISVVDTTVDPNVPFPIIQLGPDHIPTCIDFTPDGTQAYVTTLDSSVVYGDVGIIDVSTEVFQPIQPRPVPAGHPCVVISPDGRVFLSNPSTDATNTISNMVVIETDGSESNINTGSFPTGGFVLSPDGSALYALSSFNLLAGHTDVVKVDFLNNVPQQPKRIRFSPLISEPLVSDIAVTADSKHLFVTMSPTNIRGVPSVQVWDTATAFNGSTVTTAGITVIPLLTDGTITGTAAGIAMTPPTAPDGQQFAYVTVPGQNLVVVINTLTKSVVGNPIGVGNFPSRIAMSPDGSVAYVSNRGSGEISVIDTDPSSATFNQVVRTIDVGGSPHAIAVLPSVTEPPVALLGSFQCLEAKKHYTPRKYSYKRFGRITHLELKPHGLYPENFCSPVDVFPVGEEGQGISDPPNPDLTCYEKKHWKYSRHFWRWWKHKKYNGYKRHRYRSEKHQFNINNLFGDHSLRVSAKPSALCLPSGKGDESSPEPEALDRFKCFDAKKVWGTRLENRKVTVDDGIESKDGKIGKPFAFCIPVDDQYQEIQDATDYLACYKFRTKRSHGWRYSRWGHWKHRYSSEKITVNNDFGQGQKLRINNRGTLCVPSSVLSSEIIQSKTIKHDDDDDDDGNDKRRMKRKKNDDDDDD